MSNTINYNKVCFPCCSRLKPKNTEKVLQEFGNRARKLEGQKLDLDDFAQFLDVPVSDMLRDMFALFDEVNTETFHLQTYYSSSPFISLMLTTAWNTLCLPERNAEKNSSLFLQHNGKTSNYRFIAAICSRPNNCDL